MQSVSGDAIVGGCGVNNGVCGVSSYVWVNIGVGNTILRHVDIQSDGLLDPKDKWDSSRSSLVEMLTKGR